MQEIQEQTRVRSVSLEEFLAEWEWRQGDHMTLVGPTDSGKTTIASLLLPRRSYVLALIVKRKDGTFERFADYHVEREWHSGRAQNLLHKRVLLWPKIQSDADLPKQRQMFHLALADVYNHGGWCIYVDDFWYVSEFLGLRRSTQLLLMHGRSAGITFVGAAQRPSEIPLVAYSQVRHLLFWRNNDERDIRRLGGLGGADAALVRSLIPVLDDHEILYVNTRTGVLMRFTPTLRKGEEVAHARINA